MMATTTVRERIIIHLYGLLQTVPGVTGVYRSRTEALKSDECPAIVIQPVSSDPTHLINGVTEHRLVVNVEIITRGDGPDSLADPIALSAHKKILDDPRQLSLAIDTEDMSAEWTIEDADGDACALSTQYAITFRTKRNDLSELI